METPQVSSHEDADAPTPAFLAACRGERSEHTPVWFMRQAGRSLPEYREARANISMLDACLDPDLVAQLTVQPVTRHGVDAAIFFSDIVTPLRLAGIDVDIVPGRGPVLAAPIRTSAQVEALPDPDSVDFSLIQEAARRTCAGLGSTPLIGFCGAPFTLSSYLVEGGPSRDLLHTKALLFSEPATWHKLAGWCAAISGAFLRAQIAGGARAVQVFDSWVGALAKGDYIAQVQPHSAAVLAVARELKIPAIHFATGAVHLLDALNDAGATVLGIDYRLSLADAVNLIGTKVPVQGNLDPALLFAPESVRLSRTREILRAGQAAPGHIFNLGHGVPPQADPRVLTDLVDFVHSLSANDATLAADKEQLP